ncbi:MAG TPA: hypothetical protein DCF42_01860 [Lachnospiraceae bacterium]|nr:hypothetical protein [Lachnospiraceae bacterium]
MKYLFAAAAALWITLACWPATEARAYDAVEDLTVTVGYWGDREYEKNTVSLDKLAKQCGVHQAVYTWINAGGKCGTTEAEGIYLSDLMDYFQIDRSSVYYYNFFTADSSTYSGAKQQWMNTQLFSTRYTVTDSFRKVIRAYQQHGDYLENPDQYYNLQQVFDGGSYTGAAWSSRKSIKPMLALKTRSASWNSYRPSSHLDFTELAETGKPVLMFGLAGQKDVSRNLQAQMVKKIHIWFEGAPEIKAKETKIDGKVGTEKKIALEVDTPDEALTEAVRKNIQWNSTNGSVASVGSDGTVTVKGAGDASITGSYSGKVFFSVKVSGTKQSNSDTNQNAQEKTSDTGKKSGGGTDGGSGNGSGSSSGNGSGSSSGNGSGSSSGTGSGSGSGNQAGSGSGTGNGGSSSGTGQERAAVPSDSSSAASDSSDITKSDASGSTAQRTETDADSGQSSGKSSSGSSGSQSGKKVYEISGADRGVNTILSSQIKPGRMLWIVLAALLGGFAAETLYYRDQVRWNKNITKKRKRKKS